MKLSILICHLNSRKVQFTNLYKKLSDQAKPYQGEIEILVDGDNGEKTIGRKRNDLLFRAAGDYTAYIDDDDDVSDDYIYSVMDALAQDPDVVGIEGILKTSKGGWAFKHSIEFQSWYTGSDAFYRTPNHLNPVRRIIACSVGFPEIGFGEDKIYSDAIRRQLKKEVYIDHPIYIYNKELC